MWQPYLFSDQYFYSAHVTWLIAVTSYVAHIGDSARTFWERLKEHLRAPSPTYYHDNTSCHHAKLDNFFIVGKEPNVIAGTIMEAMFIRVNDPSLNRNIGKYQLPHIWDEVLLNTSPPCSAGGSHTAVITSKIGRYGVLQYH